MKYDDLMILASLEFIIICFLVYIGFKLKEALELRDKGKMMDFDFILRII